MERAGLCGLARPRQHTDWPSHPWLSEPHAKEFRRTPPCHTPHSWSYHSTTEKSPLRNPNLIRNSRKEMTFTLVTLSPKPALKEIQKNRTERKDNDKTRIPKPLDVQRGSDCYSRWVKIAPDETHQVFGDARERYRELIQRRGQWRWSQMRPGEQERNSAINFEWATQIWSNCCLIAHPVGLQSQGTSLWDHLR